MILGVVLGVILKVIFEVAEAPPPLKSQQQHFVHVELNVCSVKTQTQLYMFEPQDDPQDDPNDDPKDAPSWYLYFAPAGLNNLFPKLAA